MPPVSADRHDRRRAPCGNHLGGKPCNIPHGELEGHPGQYRTYCAGSTCLWPQCYLSTHFLDLSGIIPIGQFFRPETPEAEYDLHLALKLGGNGELWIGELILSRCDETPRPQKIIPAVPTLLAGLRGQYRMSFYPENSGKEQEKLDSLGRPSLLVE